MTCTPTNYTGIVFEGDSITAGFGVTPATTYPGLLASRALKEWFVLNAGRNGTTTATGLGQPVLSDTARLAANLKFINTSTFSRKYLSLFVGTNDLHLSTDSAATIMARIQTYLDARKAQGYQRIVMYTILPVNSVAPIFGAPSVGKATHEARRLELNQLIRNEVGSRIDGVVDLGAHPTLGNVLNTTNAALFPDGLHLSTASYELIYEASIRTFQQLN